MNVLSVFDGMSCGQIALQKLGVEVGAYYASEIDRDAMQIAKKNFPNTIHVGRVQDVKQVNLPIIDLLIGGSPCQGFSFAGRQLNFEDPRSMLFFEYVRILKELRAVNPDVKFLLENVVMKKEYQDIISKFLGVEPIKINSALVSAQNRNRLYWTNLGQIKQPKDKKIMLKDVLEFPCVDAQSLTERRTEEAKAIRSKIMKESKRDFSPRRAKELVLRNDGKANCLTTALTKEHFVLTKTALDYMDRSVKGGRNHWDFKHHSDIRENKSAAVVANFYKGVPYNVLKDWDCIRKFTPVECERLQTVPDNYTEGISATQRYKMLGNGWTVDVIAWILSYEYI